MVISISERIQQAWERFTEAACEIHSTQRAHCWPMPFTSTQATLARTNFTKGSEACGRHVLTISELSLTRLKTGQNRQWNRSPPSVTGRFPRPIIAYDGPADIDLFGLDLVREFIEITLTNLESKRPNNKLFQSFPTQQGVEALMEANRTFKGLENFAFVLDESKRLHPDVLDWTPPCRPYWVTVEVAVSVRGTQRSTLQRPSRHDEVAGGC